MKNAFFAELLKDQPERYPAALEAKFERILNRIVELWGKSELDAYFEDLMIDKRGGRQGFPPDVVRDIFSLYQVWEKSKDEKPVDPWALERSKDKLQKHGLEYSPRRFAQAVEKNELANVILFLDSGMSVDTPGEQGWTPLMTASFNGNEEIAVVLLNRGANPRFSDNAGYTPLHWSAFNGFTRATRLLLERGAHANAPTRYGWTPLMQAAARGHAEVIGMLLDARADVNHADHEGWTALHKALSNNHLEAAKLLLRRGADPQRQHQSGVSCVAVARASKNPQIRELFP